MLDAMTLSQLADTLHGRVPGDDARFDGVSIDSRAIAAGDLFVALAGPRFDGHDYLDDVAAKGAVAALVVSLARSAAARTDYRPAALRCLSADPSSA